MRKGFADVETMILMALSAVGIALVIPPILHLVRHEPVSTIAWVGFGIGIVLVLLAGGTLLKWWIKARQS